MFESVSPSLLVRSSKTLPPFSVRVLFMHLAAFLTKDQVDHIWSKKQKHGMPDCHEEFCTQIPSHPARMAQDHGFSLLVRDFFPQSSFSALLIVLPLEYRKTFLDQ